MRRILIAQKDGERIDRFICENIEGLSRNHAQRLITEGKVFINQKEEKKKNRLLQINDTVLVIEEEPEVSIPVAEKIDLNIVYEDDSLLIVDKPPGMPVHPSPGHSSGTLVNALIYHCGEKLSDMNGDERPGIVHRLDKDTSGLLVVAKDNVTHEKLANQFKQRKVLRKYLAITRNNFKQDEGVIDLALARDSKNRKKRAVVNNGKHAVSRYKVLERFGRQTLIEVELETGRTHQIRVHMAYIKKPLLGDMLYGTRGKISKSSKGGMGTKMARQFGVNRQMLHCKQIGFIHPKTDEYMEFQSKLPEDFQMVLCRLRKSVNNGAE